MGRYRSLLPRGAISLCLFSLKLQIADHAPRKPIDRVFRKAPPSPNFLLVARDASLWVRPLAASGVGPFFVGRLDLETLSFFIDDIFEKKIVMPQVVKLSVDKESGGPFQVRL